jgi:hypothetical protein
MIVRPDFRSNFMPGYPTVKDPLPQSRLRRQNSHGDRVLEQSSRLVISKPTTIFGVGASLFSTSLATWWATSLDCSNHSRDVRLSRRVCLPFWGLVPTDQVRSPAVGNPAEDKARPHAQETMSVYSVHPLPSRPKIRSRVTILPRHHSRMFRVYGPTHRSGVNK